MALNYYSMKVISKSIGLDSYGYYRTHLMLINPILPVKLSDKEIEVLASFMCYIGRTIYPFSKFCRSEVRKKLGLSHGSLTNYLGRLREKGFLKLELDAYDFNGLILPDMDRQEYNFKLIRNEQIEGVTE